MAMIKCPECGKDISTLAKNCIHCGCEFTVCPECGNACVGKPETCPNCGFVLQKKAQPSTQTVVPQTKKPEAGKGGASGKDIQEVKKRLLNVANGGPGGKVWPSVLEVLGFVATFVLAVVGFNTGNYKLVLIGVAGFMIFSIVSTCTDASDAKISVEYIRDKEEEAKQAVLDTVRSDYRKFDKETVGLLAGVTKRLTTYLKNLNDPEGTKREISRGVGENIVDGFEMLFFAFLYMRIMTILDGLGGFGWAPILIDPLVWFLGLSDIVLAIVAFGLKRSHKRKTKEELRS